MELETSTTEDVTLLTTELSMAVAEMPDQEGPFPFWSLYINQGWSIM